MSTSATSCGMTTSVRKNVEKTKTLARRVSEGAGPRLQIEFMQELEVAGDGGEMEAELELIPADEFGEGGAASSARSAPQAGAGKATGEEPVQRRAR